LNIESIGVELAWIGKHENWLRNGDVGARRTVPDQNDIEPVPAKEKSVLTVAEAATMLGVDEQTIKRKYLALDSEDKAPIPFDAWFRMPGGHIRIYRWIILKIQSSH